MKCRRCGRPLLGGSCLAHGEQYEPTAEALQDDPTPQPGKRPWTAAEDQYILEHLAEMNCEQLGLAIGRSMRGVKHRFHTLGVVKPTVRRAREPKRAHRERWTEDELELLEYGETRFLTHRSKRAILDKAQRMGFNARADGCLSMREAAAMHDLHPEIVRRMIRTGQLAAERVGGLYRIEPADAEMIPDIRRARILNTGRRQWWTK